VSVRVSVTVMVSLVLLLPLTSQTKLTLTITLTLTDTVPLTSRWEIIYAPKLDVYPKFDAKGLKISNKAANGTT